MAGKPSTSGTVTGDKPAGDSGAGGEDLSTARLLAELNAERAGGTGKGAAPTEDLEDDVDDDDDLDDEDDGEDSGSSDEDDDEADGDEDGDEDGDDEPDDDEADDDDDDGSSDADDPDEDEGEGKDPETTKRMAALRRTEQRQRQALERDRAAFERARTEWETERKELRQSKDTFDKLAARSKYDSYSVLRALGIPDEDMEYHAQQLAARSPKYAAKPEYRRAADQAMRERESADGTARALAEVDDLKKTLKERDEQAACDRDAEAYMARVARRVTDETPLTKTQLAKNPARAREGLATVAIALTKKLGRLPKAKEVAARYEKHLARELRELGIEAPAGKASPSAKADKATGRPADKSGKKPASKAKPDRDANGAVYHPSHEELMEEIRAGRHLE
jgi:hypothetical protein